MLWPKPSWSYLFCTAQSAAATVRTRRARAGIVLGQQPVQAVVGQASPAVGRPPPVLLPHQVVRGVVPIRPLPHVRVGQAHLAAQQVVADAGPVPRRVAHARQPVGDVIAVARGRVQAPRRVPFATRDAVQLAAVAGHLLHHHQPLPGIVQPPLPVPVGVQHVVVPQPILDAIVVHRLRAVRRGDCRHPAEWVVARARLVAPVRADGAAQRRCNRVGHADLHLPPQPVVCPVAQPYLARHRRLALLLDRPPQPVVEGVALQVGGAAHPGITPLPGVQPPQVIGIAVLLAGQRVLPRVSSGSQRWVSRSGSGEPLLAPRPLRTGRESFPSSGSSLEHRTATSRMFLVVAVFMHCHQIIRRVCATFGRAWDPVMQVDRGRRLGVHSYSEHSGIAAALLSASLVRRADRLRHRLPLSSGPVLSLRRVIRAAAAPYLHPAGDLGIGGVSQRRLSAAEGPSA